MTSNPAATPSAVVAEHINAVNAFDTERIVATFLRRSIKDAQTCQFCAADGRLCSRTRCPARGGYGNVVLPC